MKYFGSLNLKGAAYCISVTSTDAGRQLTAASSVLSAALHVNQSAITKIGLSISSTDDVAFLKQVQIILDGATDVGREAEEVPSSWGRIIKEIEEIGWARVAWVSPTLQEVHFSTPEDSVARRFDTPPLLEVRLPPDYPRSPPLFSSLLPVRLQIQSRRIVGAVAEWERVLLPLAPFFFSLRGIDEEVAVIEPQPPQPHHTHRRLLLECGVSVQLSVSVGSPCSLPRVSLVGPGHLVAPLNTRLAERALQWDEDRSIIENLEEILGETFSRVDQRISSTSECLTEGIECAICYCLRLEDEMPDTTCDNCNQCMHATCLYTWLSGQTGSRQSLQQVYGKCPYCDQSISCQVPSL